MKIHVSDRNVIIEHAAGQRMTICNMAGSVVAEAFVGSNAETFPIAPLPQGLYVVWVGDESATISF